jgi:methylated-DNA-[protein]-cysteine S-methyltransferase
MNTFWTTLRTPIGELLLEASDTAVTRIYFENEPAPRIGQPRLNDPLRAAKAQLTEYFAGNRTEFDFPIETTGTEFQQAVWKELLKIKFGATSTYGRLAKAIHRPITAARGVGQACGHNPLPIVVPCHRVLGKTGSLTGFGGGTWRKEWLLRHERGEL